MVRGVLRERREVNYTRPKLRLPRLRLPSRPRPRIPIKPRLRQRPKVQPSRPFTALRPRPKPALKKKVFKVTLKKLTKAQRKQFSLLPITKRKVRVRLKRKATAFG